MLAFFTISPLQLCLIDLKYTFSNNTFRGLKNFRETFASNLQLKNFSFAPLHCQMVGNQNHKPLGSKPYLWLLYIGFLQRERNSIFNLRIEMESKYLIWIKLISENLHLFFPEFMKNMKIKELNPQYKVNLTIMNLL